jgi:hypothetical protein
MDEESLKFTIFAKKMNMSSQEEQLEEFDFREIELKLLEDNRVQAKKNPLKYLPELVESLFRCLINGFIAKQEALDELNECLHEYYRLYAEGQGVLFSDIQRAVSVIAQCKEDRYAKYDKCLEMVCKYEIAYLKNRANKGNAYLPLVAFMLLELPIAIYFNDEANDDALASRKEAVAIFENLQSENKGDFRLQIAEICFTIVEWTLNKYPDKFSINTEQEILFSRYITAAIDYAQKALTVFAELVTTEKTTSRKKTFHRKIAEVHKSLVYLYNKKITSIHHELDRLPSQETLIEQEKYVWKDVTLMFNRNPSKIEWTIRNDKQAEIREYEEKTKQSYENALI